MNDLRNILKDRKPDEQRNCETHGAYTARHIFGRIWSRCPVCEDERKQEEERKEQEQKLQAEKREWFEKLGRAAIPDRFQDRTLKNYVAENELQRIALDFAVDYADNFDKVMKTGRSALFIGKPGTGKTHLSVGIALRVMRKHQASALFITCRHVFLAIKDTYRRDSERSELDVIADFVRPDLLILDEVGVQSGSDFEKQALFDILNSRYERRKPTIFLSNLPDDEVGAYLGERVMDRLKEDGGAVVPFNWGSHRGKVQP